MARHGPPGLFLLIRGNGQHVQEYRYNERKVSNGTRVAKAIEMTAWKRLMYK